MTDLRHVLCECGEGVWLEREEDAEPETPWIGVCKTCGKKGRLKFKEGD